MQKKPVEKVRQWVWSHHNCCHCHHLHRLTEYTFLADISQKRNAPVQAPTEFSSSSQTAGFDASAGDAHEYGNVDGNGNATAKAGNVDLVAAGKKKGRKTTEFERMAAAAEVAAARVGSSKRKRRPPVAFDPNLSPKHSQLEENGHVATPTNAPVPTLPNKRAESQRKRREEEKKLGMLKARLLTDSQPVEKRRKSGATAAIDLRSVQEKRASRLRNQSQFSFAKQQKKSATVIEGRKSPKRPKRCHEGALSLDTSSKSVAKKAGAAVTDRFPFPYNTDGFIFSMPFLSHTILYIKFDRHFTTALFLSLPNQSPNAKEAGRKKAGREGAGIRTTVTTSTTAAACTTTPVLLIRFFSLAFHRSARRSIHPRTPPPEK
jgi:hypothetical protein